MDYDVACPITMHEHILSHFKTSSCGVQVPLSLSGACVDIIVVRCRYGSDKRTRKG